MGLEALRRAHANGEGFLDDVVRQAWGARPSSALGHAHLRQALNPRSEVPSRRVCLLLRQVGVEHIASLLWAASTRTTRWTLDDVFEAARDVAGLTPREREVLEGFVRAGRAKEIPGSASTRTVEWLLGNARHRLAIPALRWLPWRLGTMIDGTWPDSCAEPSTYIAPQ